MLNECSSDEVREVGINFEMTYMVIKIAILILMTAKFGGVVARYLACFSEFLRS